MNRRGFLKALAAVPAAAAVPAQALAFGGAANIGAGVMGGAAAAGAAATAGMPAMMAPLPLPAIWKSYHAAEDAEIARLRWLDVWRRHRIMVRRGREKREPAKLVWLREELWVRQQAHANRQGPYREYRSDFYATRRREAVRRSGRIRAKLKLLGFPGLPWEVPCSR